MGEKKSREEKRAEREARTASRHEKNLKRHTVSCPHCGKDVLDHMTKCPFCSGALAPSGYRAPDPDKHRTVKRITYAFLIAAAIAAVVLLAVLK